MLNIKVGHYIKLLKPETMKLLGIIESKMTEDKNGKDVPHLEITEVILVHCNIVDNDCQPDLRILYTFFSNNSFSSLLEIWPTNFIFLKRLKFRTFRYRCMVSKSI